MFSAILMLLTLPLLDTSIQRGLQFKPSSKIAFWMFVANFLVLMVLGAKHVEAPFIVLGQISTMFYFSWFLLLVPVTSFFENVIIGFNMSKN